MYSSVSSAPSSVYDLTSARPSCASAAALILGTASSVPMSSAEPTAQRPPTRAASSRQTDGVTSCQ